MISCDPQSLASASACFNFCVSAGNTGPLKSYLWCQIANTKKFGGSGGGGGFLFPIPSGFSVNSNISGTVLTAAWNIPPGGVTGTEIWTAPDGVNYTLNVTVAAAFNTQFFGAIAVGSFQWFKIRFTNGAGGFSDFTAPIEWSGQAMNWAARVQTNLGNMLIPTILAANNLWCTLVNAGISGQILCMNVLAGIFNADGIAAINTDCTPFIKGAGLDPWLSQGFAGGNATINGLQCGTGNFLNTGFNLTSFASVNNAGACVYDVTGTSETTKYAFGVFDGVANDFGMWVDNAGTTEGFDMTSGTPVTGAAPGVGGLYGVHKVAAADCRLFFGNSTNTPAQLGATQAAAGGATFAQAIFVGGLNNNGTHALETSHQLSFWCATNGLSLAQFTTLFNAVQAYRVAMGGGFV